MLVRLISKLDPEIHDLARRASMVFLLRVLGALFGFGLAVLIARLLGAQGAGVFGLAMTCVTAATVFGRCGMDNAVLRYMAAGFSAGNYGEAASAFRVGMRITLAASAVSAVAIFLGAEFIAARLFQDPAVAAPLRILALAVVPIALFNILAQALKALRHSARATLVQATAMPLVAGAMLLPFVVLGAEVETVALVQTAAAVLVMAIGFRLWRKFRQTNSVVNSDFDLRRFLATAHPLYLVSLVTLVTTSADVLILGVFETSDSVGIYAAAVSSVSVISLVLIAVNTVAAPRFASLFAEGQIEALGRFARQCTGLMILAAAPVFLVLFIWPEWILALFGPEFVASANALSILAIGQFVNVATGSVGFILMMSNNGNIYRNIVILSAFMNLLLNLLLIPQFAILGAAMATAISVAFSNIFSMIMIQRKLSFLTIPMPGPDRSKISTPSRG